MSWWEEGFISDATTGSLSEIQKHPTPRGQWCAGEELADGDILCPKLWPVSGQALSQPHRWAWALRAAWPWQLLKVVFYRAKFPPTVVPPAVHTEHIHLQVGRDVCHCPFVFEWNKLSAWKTESPKWGFSDHRGNSDGRRSHWTLLWSRSAWGWVWVYEGKVQDPHSLSFSSQSA